MSEAPKIATEIMELEKNSKGGALAVKKVAEAIETKRRELINQPLSRIYQQLALSAIEAMRIQMVVAGENMGDMSSQWNVMIAAALKEPEPA